MGLPRPSSTVLPGPAASAVRVLLADASRAYRGALARLLTNHPIEIVGEAADTVELCLNVERLRPQVVLLDPELPGVDGLQTAQSLTGVAEPALIFLSLVDEDIKERCAAIRRARFVLKEHADRTLLKEIFKAARGSPVG